MSRFTPLVVALFACSAACVFDPPLAVPEDAGATIDEDGGGDDGDAEPLDRSASKDGAFENRAPIAIADSATVAPGAASIDIAVLANDSDPDGDPLTILTVDSPSSGSASVGTTPDSTILYTPAASFAGRDGFTYRITDGLGHEAVGEVEVFVLPDRLVISPLSAELNLNSRGPFSASGGVPPYTFEIASGTGEIDASSGEFFSDGIPGGARVVVEDSAGSTSTATVTFGNGDLFYFAGTGRFGDERDVFRSADGIGWSSAGSLPSTLYLHGAAVFDDRIFIAGGRNGSFAASEVVLTSNDGASWTVAGSLPLAVRGAPLIVFQRQLISLGGRDAFEARRDEVYASTDGASWTLLGRLPESRAYGSAFVHDGELWYVGGTSGISVSAVQIWSSADGSTWVERGSLPEPRLFLAAAEHDGQVWLMGGSVDASDAVDNTWRSSNGFTFTDGVALPSSRATACALSWRGSVWLVGGADDLTSQVEVLPEVLTVAPNGEWANAGALPSGRYWGAMVIYRP